MAARFVDRRVALTLLLTWGAAAWAQRAGSDSLGTYIPGDVWIYVHAKGTPSREFLIPHWNRVFRALRSSGIDQEFARVIGANLSPEQRAEFDATWAEVNKSFQAIQWPDLLGREVAFAERFGGLMPEFFILTRPNRPAADQSIQALTKLMEYLASLAKGSAAFRNESAGGVQVWSIESTSAPVGFYLIQTDSVLALTLGKQAMEDCRALLTGAGKGTCIEECSRFRAALKDVPPAEYAESFFDVHEFLQVLDKLPDRVLGEMQAQHHAAEPSADTPVDTTGLTTVRRVLHSINAHLDFIDYVVTTSRMDGRRELTSSVTRLRPEAMHQPICRMITRQTPFTEVHRYIPEEATGFQASTFIDPTGLYRTALEIIRTDVPNGEDLCQRWADTQDAWSFHVEEDLLGWISGELIMIELPPLVPNPTGEGDSVLLVRVRDASKARTKVQAGLDRAAKFLSERGQPVIVQPPEHLPADQFQRVSHPMTMMIGMQPCIGVWQDWLVVGSREKAIQKVIDTAAGKHPSILTNGRYRAEGLKLDEAVVAASFTDLSNLGQELPQFFIGMGFAAAMLPDEPETRTIKAIINSLSRLGPVVAEINFFSSQATQTTYADGVFTSTNLITYKADTPR